MKPTRWFTRSNSVRSYLRIGIAGTLERRIGSDNNGRGIDFDLKPSALTVKWAIHAQFERLHGSCTRVLRSLAVGRRNSNGKSASLVSLTKRARAWLRLMKLP